MKLKLAHLLKPVLELIFPETCIHCQDKTTHRNNIALCLMCELQLESAYDSELKIKQMHHRFKGIIQTEVILAQFYFMKDGVSQSIIHEAKYNNQTDILKHYATVMANRITTRHILSDIPDIVIPVPNNWTKRLKNGYNQAEIYSSTIAKNLEITHSTKLLKKRADRSSQTTRNKVQRLRHLNNLYYTNNPTLIKDKHILLIDDVITSGATIEICTNLLLQNGATKVSILTFMSVK